MLFRDMRPKLVIPPKEPGGLVVVVDGHKVTEDVLVRDYEPLDAEARAYVAEIGDRQIARDTEAALRGNKLMPEDYVRSGWRPEDPPPTMGTQD